MTRSSSNAAATGHETCDADILILGAGGAGLFAALHAQRANPDLRIAVVAKGLLGKSGCTRMVQGGYNAALGRDDSVERHFMDTIRGGKWLPHQAMAWRLCATAVERVRQLEDELGCFFDRNRDGSIHQKPFAGQSRDRTVHKGDLTGIEIMNRLMERVMASPLIRMDEHRALALARSRRGDAVRGALLLDLRSGAFRLVRAGAVLLATGGGPSMYRYHTPSGDKSMDGLAMALRLGLALRDMEMVQFHPTGLLAGRDTRMTGTVLEEGLRGAGGHLLDADGRRFVFDYDSAGERATRDVVSRAMVAAMRAGRAAPNGGVYLSMAHLGAARVAAQFPGMVKRCADCGFDLAGGRVEVVPTAHYFMGGVVCDADAATEMLGLFVAGEDAGGVHGANRLGGNGVANSTVYGGIAGARMARDAAADAARDDIDEDWIAAEIAAALRPLRARAEAPAHLHALRQTLMDVMWRDVGVLRDDAGLHRALGELDSLREEIARLGVAESDRAFNPSWQDWLNLRNLIDISAVIARAALSRRNSRGAHFREDFPDDGDLSQSRFTVSRAAADGIEVTQQPVAFTIVRPGESLLDEDAP